MKLPQRQKRRRDSDERPFDVMTVGRMAVIQDPTGAVFALWQAKDTQGAGSTTCRTRFAGMNSAPTTPQKAGDFYSNVFGWARETFLGPMEYTISKTARRGVAGMYKITPEMGPMPPHWLVYFAVDDCDANVQKATELGGSVMKPAEDIPGVGRFAILTIRRAQRSRSSNSKSPSNRSLPIARLPIADYVHVGAEQIGNRHRQLAI